MRKNLWNDINKFFSLSLSLFSRQLITLKPIASGSHDTRPLICLLFLYRKNYFSATRACKGFHIGQAWKYRPHVPRTRHSHLYRGIPCTSRADGRSCFISKSFFSHRHAKIVDINNRDVSCALNDIFRQCFVHQYV